MRDENLCRALERVADANCLCALGGYLHLMAFVAFDLLAADNGVTLRGILYNWATSQDRVLITPELIHKLFGDRIILVQDDFEKTSSAQITFDIMLGGVAKTTAFAALPGKSSHKANDAFDPQAFYFCYAACGNPPFFAINAALSQQRPLTTVSLEEGIGTYTADVFEWRNMGASRSKNLFKRCAINAYSLLLHPIDKRVSKLLDDDCQHINCTLFSPHDHPLRINDHLKPYFDRSLELLCIHADIEDDSKYANSVIIATAKFEVFGCTDEEMRVLAKTISYLQCQGINVILRPHPGTSDTSRYDDLAVAKDANQGVPLEALIMRLKEKPLGIIGFASSSLTYCNALYNIPAISLELLLEMEAAQQRSQNTALDGFLSDVATAYNVFDHPYERPSSYGELKVMISNLK